MRDRLASVLGLLALAYVGKTQLDAIREIERTGIELASRPYAGRPASRHALGRYRDRMQQARATVLALVAAAVLVECALKAPRRARRLSLPSTAYRTANLTIAAPHSWPSHPVVRARWWVWFGGAGSVTVLAMATFVPVEVEPATTGTTVGSQEKVTTTTTSEETSAGVGRRSGASLVCGGP